jgi:hypothetical protein
MKQLLSHIGNELLLSNKSATLNIGEDEKEFEFYLHILLLQC